MAYDIYGNHLRRGYCEVHPDIPEEYPCSGCMERHSEQRYPEPDYPEPTVIDYIEFNPEAFQQTTNEILKAATENNEDTFIKNVDTLLNLLNTDFILSRIRDMQK